MKAGMEEASAQARVVVGQPECAVRTGRRGVAVADGVDHAVLGDLCDVLVERHLAGCRVCAADGPKGGGGRRKLLIGNSALPVMGGG